MLTRQLLQPSVNFLAPTRTLTVEWGLLMSWNSEPENSRYAGREAGLFAQFHELGIVANVDNTERVVFSAKAKRYFTDCALEIFNVNLTASGRIEEGSKCLGEDLLRCRAFPVVFRYVNRPANRFFLAAVSRP